MGTKAAVTARDRDRWVVSVAWTALTSRLCSHVITGLVFVLICHGPRAAVSDVDGPCNRSRSAGHRVGVRPGARSCPSQHRRRTERPEERDAERRKAPWSHVIDVHYTREQWYVLFEDECVYIYMCKAPEHVLASSSAARVQGSGRRPVLGVKGRSRSGTSFAWTV